MCQIIAEDKLLGDNIIFSAYTQKLSAIASGATTIGSTGRAPDKKKSTKRKTKRLKFMIG
jgi:hypothetical protein